HRVKSRVRVESREVSPSHRLCLGNDSVEIVSHPLSSVGAWCDPHGCVAAIPAETAARSNAAIAVRVSPWFGPIHKLEPDAMSQLATLALSSTATGNNSATSLYEVCDASICRR